MWLRSLAKSLFLLTLIGVSVHADPPATPAPAAAPDQTDSNVSLSAAELSKLTAPEMTTGVTNLHTQVEQDYQKTLRLAAVARKQADVIRLTCVNNKLVEMKAEMNVLDVNSAQFQSQITESADAARSSYAQVAELGNKVRSLSNDASACAGVPDLTKQDSGVTVNAPTFPDDPTVGLTEIVTIEPPAYASPFN
jgi:hypothetical protein